MGHLHVLSFLSNDMEHLVGDYHTVILSQCV